MASPIGSLHTEIVNIGRCTCIHTIAVIERPQLTGLLIIAGSIQFHIYTLEYLMPRVPHSPNSDSTVHQCLDRIGQDRIDLSSSVLSQSLQRSIEMKTRIRIVKLETSRQPDRKSFLMDIISKNKTFPVHPRIQIEPAGMIQQL